MSVKILLVSLFLIFSAPVGQTNACSKNSHENTQATEMEIRIKKYVSKYKKRFKNHSHFSFVDYRIPIHKERFFVYDLKEEKIIFSTFVGHAYKSGEYFPDDTSNTPDTKKTSIGLFRVGKQYYGNFGKSKRLHGLEKTNSNGYRRAIVAHSMSGIMPSDLYSWGCFTFFEGDLEVVFNFMKKGSYLLAVK